MAVQGGGAPGCGGSKCKGPEVPGVFMGLQRDWYGQRFVRRSRADQPGGEATLQRAAFSTFTLSGMGTHWRA